MNIINMERINGIAFIKVVDKRKSFLVLLVATTY